MTNGSERVFVLVLVICHSSFNQEVCKNILNNESKARQ